MENQQLYLHNSLILEISNNLSYIKKLYNNYISGKLKKMSKLDKEWLVFITNKNINIQSYIDDKTFIEENFKIIV